MGTVERKTREDASGTSEMAMIADRDAPPSMHEDEPEVLEWCPDKNASEKGPNVANFGHISDETDSASGWRSAAYMGRKIEEVAITDSEDGMSFTDGEWERALGDPLSEAGVNLSSAAAAAPAEPGEHESPVLRFGIYGGHPTLR